MKAVTDNTGLKITLEWGNLKREYNIGGVDKCFIFQASHPDFEKKFYYESIPVGDKK